MHPPQEVSETEKCLKAEDLGKSIIYEHINLVFPIFGHRAKCSFDLT